MALTLAAVQKKLEEEAEQEKAARASAATEPEAPLLFEVTSSPRSASDTLAKLSGEGAPGEGAPGEGWRLQSRETHGEPAAELADATHARASEAHHTASGPVEWGPGTPKPKAVGSFFADLRDQEPGAAWQWAGAGEQLGESSRSPSSASSAPTASADQEEST
jgi:hypothetical protein